MRLSRCNKSHSIAAGLWVPLTSDDENRNTCETKQLRKPLLYLSHEVRKVQIISLLNNAELLFFFLFEIVIIRPMHSNESKTHTRGKEHKRWNKRLRYGVNIFNIYIFINFHCATSLSHTENMLQFTHPDISKNKNSFSQTNRRAGSATGTHMILQVVCCNKNIIWQKYYHRDTFITSSRYCRVPDQNNKNKKQNSSLFRSNCK